MIITWFSLARILPHLTRAHRRSAGTAQRRDALHALPSLRSWGATNGLIAGRLGYRGRRLLNRAPDSFAAPRAFFGRRKYGCRPAHGPVIDEHWLLDRYFQTGTNNVESLRFPLLMDKVMVERGLVAGRGVQLEDADRGLARTAVPAFGSPFAVPAVTAGRTKRVRYPTAAA